MSWAKLKRDNRTWGHIRGVSVRISAQGYAGPRLIMRIARTLAQAAGLSLEKISRVDVLIGEGTDAGWLIVGANPDGEWRCYAAGKLDALKIVTVTPPGAPAEWAATQCAGATGDGGLMFRLPWADASTSIQQKSQDASERKPNGRLNLQPAPSPSDEEEAHEPGEAADHLASEKELGPLESSKPKPPAPSIPAKPKPAPPVQRKLFKHNGGEVWLNPGYHAIASALKAAIGKGFLDYAKLCQTGKISTVEQLHGAISALRAKVEPLGLEIGVQKKMGYWMREAAKQGVGAS